MTDRTATALMKTGLIAVAYFCALAYRQHARGELLSSRRPWYGAALVLASFVVAMTWQAMSKVRNWSWWMTFLCFTLSLIIVTIATVSVFRALA